MTKHIQLGKLGEAIAATHLQKDGHTILCQNYVFDKAEIDIISSINDLIVFTEVKTRSTEKYGYPEEAVSKNKQDNIARAAENYLHENEIDKEIRFDVISIIINNKETNVHHIKDAFFPIDN